MGKKIKLLTLVAVTAALFALPATGSAQEIHFEGPTTFTGSGGAASIVVSGDPTLTIESIDVTNGTLSAGGTTGTMTLDFTGCHATVLGFTVKCHTAGSPSDNTVAWAGSFHLITWKNASGTAFPAFMFTPNTLEITFGGISNMHFEGNGIIGTITSPACGTSSTTTGLSFSATGSTQNHIAYTGTNYDLKGKTVGGSQLTAGFNAALTLTSSSGILNCT